MKINSFRIILLLFFANYAQAQDTKENVFRTSVEYGYFASSFFRAENGGDYLNTSFGYKINQDFWLNLDIIKISATGNPEFNPLRGDIVTNYSNTMFIPNFSKDWTISSKALFKTTLGGALYFEKAYEPSLFIQDSQLFFEYINEVEEIGVGLFINLAFLYEVHKNIYIGLNIKSYVGLYLEPDSLMIGPSVEFRL